MDTIDALPDIFLLGYFILCVLLFCMVGAFLSEKFWGE